MGNKISIAEARARRTDPVWRRRHKAADLAGIAAVALLLGVPLIATLVDLRLGEAVGLAVLVLAPVAMLWQGPMVGFERRAAILAAVPVAGLAVLVPAVWRASHLHLQRWQGPLDPRWEDSVWWLVGAASAVLWLATVAVVVRLLA